jgi:hypothetical protein
MHLILPNHSETVIALPESLRVRPTPDLEDALEHALGARAGMDDLEPAAGPEAPRREVPLDLEPSEDFFEGDADDDPGQDFAPLEA